MKPVGDRRQAIIVVRMALLLLGFCAGAPTPAGAQNESFEAGKVFRDCPEMVVIPDGTFKMGSNRGRNNEKAGSRGFDCEGLRDEHHGSDL